MSTFSRVSQDMTTKSLNTSHHYGMLDLTLIMGILSTVGPFCKNISKHRVLMDDKNIAAWMYWASSVLVLSLNKTSFKLY